VPGAAPGSAPTGHRAVHCCGLVAELPERPRRFLLRLAEGHSYREIAAVEAVSVRAAARQIARARRLVRALDADQAA